MCYNVRAPPFFKFCLRLCLSRACPGPITPDTGNDLSWLVEQRGRTAEEKVSENRKAKLCSVGGARCGYFWGCMVSTRRGGVC